jgi:hypothetical protein
VTPVLGVNSPQAFRGRFLFGQQLGGEQSELRPLGSKGSFCRRKPAFCDVSGLWPIEWPMTNLHAYWG